LALPPVFISFRAAGVGGGVTAAEMYGVKDFSRAYRWRGKTYANALASLRPDPRPARLKGRDVWFMVHGYNTDRDRGIMSLGAAAQEYLGMGVQAAQIATAEYDSLGKPRPAFAALEDLIPVLWPGDAQGIGFLKATSYPFEISDVRRTAEEFRKLLLGPETRPARINFITHSLGARVALDTLRELIAHSATPPAFGTVLMMAAAADDDILDDPRFARVVERVERFVVLSSFEDKVLELAFPVGDPIEAALHRGESASVRALGRYGPRLKKGSPAIGKVDWFQVRGRVGQDHDDYNPWPWNQPATSNGWSSKRWRAHRLSRHAGVDYDAGKPDAWREGDDQIVKRQPTIDG
jgi:hypothetical protein